MALGLIQSLFSVKKLLTETQFCQKRLTQFRQGESFFGNAVDFRKRIFRVPESLSKSRL